MKVYTGRQEASEKLTDTSRIAITTEAIKRKESVFGCETCGGPCPPNGGIRRYCGKACRTLRFVKRKSTKRSGTWESLSSGIAARLRKLHAASRRKSA